MKKRLRGVEYLVELESGEKTKEWNDFDFNKIHKMPLLRKGIYKTGIIRGWIKKKNTKKYI